MKHLLYGDADDRKLRSALEKALDPDSSLEVLPMSSFARSWRKKASGCFVWLDAAGLAEARVVELGRKLDEVASCAWGVVDRGGEIGDPAALFFAGASDYLGPKLLRAPIPPSRLQSTLAYAGFQEAEVGGEGPLPSFPGWAALTADEEVSVRFCHAALAGQKELLERIGEKRLNKLREDFAAFLEPWSAECGGIVWIKESTGCLVLFPPQDQGMNPVLAAFRLLLDRAIVGYEVFHLEIPLSFHFAFHAGTSQWRPPGSTGTLISDDVNFIFHLGARSLADGVILVSREAEAAIPASLSDLFLPQGDFEGHELMVTKRFKD